ncbi:MAG TPA: ParB/RepB/Spo0J family partition protein [Candidatus Woesebacteria bacterium]|nr:ParB/RepB/Spo0J family partition protein [Candidatus Woesebacteria bacterium]
MPVNVQKLPISYLQPNPFQPRDKVKKEDIEELVESIRVHGILEPLVVAETPAGYQIIAGERRWRAAKVLGIEEVPVFIKKTSPQGMLELAIVENLQRYDLNPIERAQSFQRLQREFNLSTSEVAQRIGKSPAYISNSLKLLTLPDAISDGLLSEQISEGHARALASISSTEAMIACYKIVLKENASVRRTEELVRRFKNNELTTSKKDDGRGRPLTQDEQQVAVWEKKFQGFFKNKSNLKVIRSRKQTKVTITLDGSPDQTQADLQKLMSIAN